MAHHKRRKRKTGGARGCGLCKPWKTRGCGHTERHRQVIRADVTEREERNGGKHIDG